MKIDVNFTTRAIEFMRVFLAAPMLPFFDSGIDVKGKDFAEILVVVRNKADIMLNFWRF